MPSTIHEKEGSRNGLEGTGTEVKKRKTRPSDKRENIHCSTYRVLVVLGNMISYLSAVLFPNHRKEK